MENSFLKTLQMEWREGWTQYFLTNTRYFHLSRDDFAMIADNTAIGAYDRTDKLTNADAC